MTLIITNISRYGIVHASDSNLTGGNEKNAGTGQKTFPIEYLSAGLTLAGSYSVGGTRMDKWMNEYISRQKAHGDKSLKNFCLTLKDALQKEMTKAEKDGGSLIHIAGYVEEDKMTHPEFWFIRNVHGMDSKTGEYKDIDDAFEISEDFWARDCPKRNLMRAFQDDSVYARQIYVNGFTAGRVGFNAVSHKLDEFFLGVWSNRNWKFRHPKSLEDTERLVKLYMQSITDLFILSDYNAQYIGGGVQTHLIKQPPNVVDSCS
jgi:hypothetical protein